MPDDKLKTSPDDSTRINIHESYEVQYWTDKFRCTKDELEAAVKAVGNSAWAVQTHLREGAGGASREGTASSSGSARL